MSDARCLGTGGQTAGGSPVTRSDRANGIPGGDAECRTGNGIMGRTG